jgi:hypothetical protein
MDRAPCTIPSKEKNNRSKEFSPVSHEKLNITTKALTLAANNPINQGISGFSIDRRASNN